MIDNFSGKFRFLSNFYPVNVKYDGEVYPSTEHAFQAAKTLNKEDREKIRLAGSPGEAKKLGKTVTLREGWEGMKISVMLDLLIQKFSQEPFRQKLKDTEDFYLIEGNTWGDKFWGVCNGRGKNILGQLLMAVRTNLE